jgi:choline dehydrogenase-like flavoprotein
MPGVFDPGSAPVIRTVDGGSIDCDIVIIGSGMGGATLANAVRDSGARVLVLKRGDFLPRVPANWSPVEVFQRHRYKNAGQWYDGATGQPFSPGVHYYVGGNTKVYGACLPRFRVQDFEEIKHYDGFSRPGPSPTRTWSPSTPRPSACIRSTANRATTRWIRRDQPTFPSPRLSTSRLSRHSRTR